ncbi:MAG TPA: hypothetical protein VMJ10_14970 [Kofleriaceae bacterium]|nr:hypothetical protein [Kofleriaceae bacterium]
MNPETLIETIRAATADGASDDARRAGANACRAVLAVLDAQPGTPIVPSTPPALEPSPPIAAIVSALRGMPRDQLADLLIAKLRTLVPDEAQVAPAHNFNIPLVKVPTP